MSENLHSSYQMNTWDKARQINANSAIYGSFAEIGAGQEVARWFFRAGRASATIAKTMSAYDMVFSDSIYGKEENGRYVCESRLLKMLRKEYSLIRERLWDIRGKDSQFFVFADTMASKSAVDELVGGHGWLGVRFQTTPLGEENDVVIHIRMLDDSSLDQQEAVGIIGVNLIYGCFHYHSQPEKLIQTLQDGTRGHHIEIDMIRFSGPAFSKVDNRLMSLHLVDLGLADAVLINPKGEAVQPSDTLFRKNLLVQRGRFRPLTNLHADMLESTRKQFLKDKEVAKKDLVPICEISLHNLSSASSDSKSKMKLDMRDFLDRVILLNKMGYYVMVSNYAEYHRISEFFAKHTNGKIAIAMGIGHLNKIFDKTYYKDLRGGLLEALGSLFRENVKAFVYPAHSLSLTTPSTPERGKKLPIIDLNSYAPPSDLKDIYSHLIHTGCVVQVENYDSSVLSINADEVLKQIQKKSPQWKKFVSETAARTIEEENLFSK